MNKNKDHCLNTRAIINDSSYQRLNVDNEPEDGSNGEVTTVSWITSGHHVLAVKHLLC